MFNGNTRRRRVKETEEIFETIMTENPSCQIMSDTNTQIQEAQRTPSKIYAKKKNKNKNTEAYHIHTTENQR